MVGSPNYCSPEVVRQRQYSGASDMWAFGVIVFYLATGFAPFEGKTQSETLDNIRNFGAPGQGRVGRICDQETLKRALDSFSKVDFEDLDRGDSELMRRLVNEMICKCLREDPRSRPAPSELLWKDPDGFFALSHFFIEPKLASLKSAHAKRLRECLKNWHESKPAQRAPGPLRQVKSKKTETSVSTIENSKEMIWEDPAIESQAAGFKRTVSKCLKSLSELETCFLGRIRTKQGFHTHKLSLGFGPRRLDLGFKKSGKKVSIDLEKRRLTFYSKAKNGIRLKMALDRAAFQMEHKNDTFFFESASELADSAVLKIACKTVENLAQVIVYLEDLLRIVECQLVDYEISFAGHSEVRCYRSLDSTVWYLFMTRAQAECPETVSQLQGREGESDLWG